MKKRFWGRQGFPIAILSLMTGLCHSLAAAPSDGPLSAQGTALIDGIMSAGEWDGAAQLGFNANLPEGGTAPATLLVMNDGVNLYIAARVPRSQLEEVQFILEFDNDNDEIAPENGDDSVGLVVRPGSASFLDNYRTNEPPCPPGHPPDNQIDPGELLGVSTTILAFSP